MIPRAKRVGWVVLFGILAALSVVTGPALVDAVLYRQVEETFATTAVHRQTGMVVYGRRTVNRWTGKSVGINHLLAFHSSSQTQFRVDTRNDPDSSVDTVYSETGQVVSQQRKAEPRIEAPPWLYPVHYNPEEMRILIHEAKLYLQQAAADGKLVLPKCWEAVE